MGNQSVSTKSSVKSVSRAGVILKSASIVVLILLLHVPLLMVRGTLEERKRTRNEAVMSIARSWGGAQTLVGPFLVIPAVWIRTEDTHLLVDGKIVRSKEPTEEHGWAYLFPASLKLDADVETSIRYRGIFETVVYRTQVALAGTFNRSDPALKDLDCRLDWDKARLVLGLSDLRGIAAAPQLEVDGGRVEFSPGSGVANLGPGLSAPVELNRDGGMMSFAADLSFQGSGRLSFVPVAAENATSVTGNWATPAFLGSYLPAEREVGADGFLAWWAISSFGRPFPQFWTDRAQTDGANWVALKNSGYGVELITPVDAYRTVERSLKYGILFFVLVFTVFFLFEVIARVRVHPFQYLLVGAALCLFYLGFLSLGEIVGQGAAYLLSALACISMITLYSFSILRSGVRSLYVAAGLGVTYLCLYLVLRMEDFALLAGTVALFSALSLVMFLTRRIDWYRLDGSTPGNSGEIKAQAE